MSDISDNKAKAISAELLKLNLKNKLEELGKKDETGRKRKTGRKKHQKTKRNWMILKEAGRKRKKKEETGRNRKKFAEWCQKCVA